jgi:hypothetical protein
MRKLIRLAAAVLGFGISGAAHAAALGFTGTLSVAIANLPPISISGAGTALVSGTGTALAGLQLPAAIFATAASIPVTSTAAVPVKGALVDLSNAAGDFSGSPLAGPMAALGSATLCLFAACDAAPPANLLIPFTEAGTRGIGIGGPPIAVSGLVNLTVQGAPWTVGKVTSASAAVTGFVHGPASGGAATAAVAGGSLQLVTPIRIQTNLVTSPELPAFGILTLTFVPEPGTLLLVAAGAAGLAALGRSRTRAYAVRPR